VESGYLCAQRKMTVDELQQFFHDLLIDTKKMTKKTFYMTLLNNTFIVFLKYLKYNAKKGRSRINLNFSYNKF